MTQFHLWKKSAISSIKCYQCVINEYKFMEKCEISFSINFVVAGVKSETYIPGKILGVKYQEKMNGIQEEIEVDNLF